jgi:hypothetical protein
MAIGITNSNAGYSRAAADARFLADALADGKQYARKDGNWEEIVPTAFMEALPVDESFTAVTGKHYSVNTTPQPLILENGIAINLQAYWKLDDLNDMSLNDNVLTNFGGVVFGPGKIGDCAIFSSGSKLFGSPMALTGRSLTLSYWVKTPAMGSGYPGYSRPFTTSGAVSSFISGSDTERPRGITALELIFDGGYVSAEGTIPVDDDQWHHVCSVCDGNSIKIFVDNALDIELTSLPTGSLTIDTTQTVINGEPGGGTFGSVAIKYDSMGVWNRALTPLEISYLYNSGNGSDIDEIATIEILTTLPTSPSPGDIIQFSDSLGIWDVSPLKIDPGILAINGSSSIYTNDIPNNTLTLVYINNTIGWATYNTKDAPIDSNNIIGLSIFL